MQKIKHRLVDPFALINSFIFVDVNKIMRFKDIIDHLHTVAPNHLQENYDNAGLIVGSMDTEVQSVLICLDVTEAVLEEAKKLACNLVIAHHPIVFRGLKRFNGTSYVERVVMKAIKEDIGIFAIHTNLDNVFYQGVNAKIADKIGLEKTSILLPKENVHHNDELVGAGMIGYLPEPMESMLFLESMKSSMNINSIKYTTLVHKTIHKVAVCGGSGGFLLSKAKREGAQIFITADYKYHEFFDANDEIIIADIGHYESEQFTIELLHEIISQKFSNFAAHCTKIVTNPVKYL